MEVAHRRHQADPLAGAAGPGQRLAQLLLGPDDLHAARPPGSRPSRGRARRARRRAAGAPAPPRASAARWPLDRAWSPRAIGPVSACGAALRPVGGGAQDQRREQLACVLDPGRASSSAADSSSATRRLDAIEAAAWYAARSLLGDLEGAHAEGLRELAREARAPPASEPAIAAGVPLHRRLVVGEGLKRVQREGRAPCGGRRGEQIESAGAADVADEGRTLGDVAPADVGDRGVRHAEQDAPASAGHAAPRRRASEPHLEAGELSRAGERAADAATATTTREEALEGGGEGIPFQFPHRRYQTALC